MKQDHWLFTWLDNLARWVFDKQLTSVKVCNCHLKATESLHQADTLDHMQVTALTAEILV